MVIKMKKAYFEKRLTVLGVPMIYRSRVRKSRGYCIESGAVFHRIHFGKRSLLIQKIRLANPKRRVWNTFTWSK